MDYMTLCEEQYRQHCAVLEHWIDSHVAACGVFMMLLGG